MKELRIALQLQPRSAKLHHDIALIYFQFQKYNKAVKHLKKSLELKPDFTQARVNLGRYLIEINKITQAIRQLKIAQKDLTYRYAENIHTNLGLAYYKRGQFDMAQQQFNVARKMNNQDCTTALYHGQSLYFLRKFNRAITIFEQTKTWCEPSNSSPCDQSQMDKAYFWTARTYHNMHQKQQAISHLKTLLSKYPKSKYQSKATNLIKRWSM